MLGQVIVARQSTEVLLSNGPNGLKNKSLLHPFHIMLTIMKQKDLETNVIIENQLIHSRKNRNILKKVVSIATMVRGMSLKTLRTTCPPPRGGESLPGVIRMHVSECQATNCPCM